MSCLVTVASGVIAGTAGSMLTTRFPRKHAKICSYVSLLSLPCALVMVLSGRSFWLTMAMQGLLFAIGECYWTPMLSMMNKSVPRS